MSLRLSVEKAREVSLLLLPPIFRACLAKEDGRFSLSAPFLAGDFVVASDTRIMVRQAATPAIAELLGLCPNRKLPKEPLFGTWEHRDTPTPLPVDLPGETECDACDGRGWRWCNIHDHQYPCEVCDARGQFLDPWHDVYLAPDVPIGLEYAWILKYQHALIYLPSEPPDKPVRFTVDAVEGQLMPRLLPENRPGGRR